MAREVQISGGALTVSDVVAVSRGDAAVRLSAPAIESMRRSRAVVESHLADGRAHYGINTGFGSLSQQRIADADLAALQQNLVRSHAAGVGPPLPREVVRATMLLLAASLARGKSGVRPAVAESLVSMLNSGLCPVVPEIGSVGASGDLAPLAHVALALTGEGEAFDKSGVRVPGVRAMQSAGLGPLSLQAKEGLALINGTHLMGARGALLLAETESLLDAAFIACAMSIDACKATDAFLDERLYAARNQPGPAAAAVRLRSLLVGSTIIPSHRENDPRVQDPYSLRCAPVILGAAVDALGYVKHAVEAELGAVTDNPLVFTEDGSHGPIVSGGNFHGMPLAIPLDVLAIAIAHIAGVSERRAFYLLAATDPVNRIPAYLSLRPGLHSGLMIAQYTAAACCNEIQGLAAPASVANIPTSAGMEDYNSFGPRAATKAARSIELARCVLAVELLCACEAIDHHRPLVSGAKVEAAHCIVRAKVPRLTHDRPPAPDIDSIAALIRQGALAGP